MGCSKIDLKKLVIAAVLIYCVSCSATVSATEQLADTEDEWIGPHVDKIRYLVFNGSDPTDDYDDFRIQIQHLLDGDIDVMSTQAHDPTDIDALRTAENVELVQFWRHAAYYADINCYNWPLNISGVRKALLLALDKNSACAIQGVITHDSLLPIDNPFSVESEMDRHYYDADVAAGVNILESLGFVDSDGDGWREGPGGIEIDPIKVNFYRPTGNGPMEEDFANFIVQAFHNLNISAYSTRVYDYYEYWADVDAYKYDITLYAMIGPDMTLDNWIEIYLNNYQGWTNSTFGEYADIALHSTDYDEVKEAVKQLQRILIEDAPTIIFGQQPLFSAYRTDTFEGIVEHGHYGPHSFFTGISAYNASVNATGGMLRFGTLCPWLRNETVYLSPSTCDLDVNTWFTIENHMEMMHDSLAIIDPDLNVMNWLAEDVRIESHGDDASIPEGSTRIQIEIVPNAKWSDGEPLTADDVVYTIKWVQKNMHYDDRDTDEVIPEFSRCIALTPTRLEIQFPVESYWNWYRICFLPILPAHAPNQYDPVRNCELTPEEFNGNLVVSGPFMASEWVKGEYIELVQNPYYWRNPKNIPEVSNNTSTTGTPTQPPVDIALPLAVGAIGAASVIIVGGIIVQKRYT